MARTDGDSISRRKFLATTALGTAATVASPAVITASKTDQQVIVGTGDFRYEVIHHWPQLPDRFHWQTTHNVAIDQSGFLYVIHEGHADQPDHPARTTSTATTKTATGSRRSVGPVRAMANSIRRTACGSMLAAGVSRG